VTVNAYHLPMPPHGLFKKPLHTTSKRREIGDTKNFDMACVRAAYTAWCKDFNKESDDISFKQFSKNFMEMEKKGYEMILNDSADSKDYIDEVLGASKDNLFCRLVDDKISVGLGYLIDIREPATLIRAINPDVFATMKKEKKSYVHSRTRSDSVETDYEANSFITGSLSIDASLTIVTISGHAELDYDTVDKKANSTRAVNIFHSTTSEDLHVHGLKKEDLSLNENKIPDYSHIVTSLIYGKSCSGLISLTSNTKDETVQADGELKIKLASIPIGGTGKISYETREIMEDNTFSVSLTSLGANKDDGIPFCHDLDSFHECTQKFCSESAGENPTVIAFRAMPLSLLTGFENCVTISTETQEKISRVLYNLDYTMATVEECMNIVKRHSGRSEYNGLCTELYEAALAVQTKVETEKRTIRGKSWADLKTEIYQNANWSWCDPVAFHITEDAKIKALRDAYKELAKELPQLINKETFKDYKVTHDKDKTIYLHGKLFLPSFWSGDWSDEERFSLDEVFGVDDYGVLIWKKNGNFSEKSRNPHLVADRNGIYLTCECRVGKEGEYHWNSNTKRIPLENNEGKFRISSALVTV
jgi:hypothetical protein